MMIRCGIISEKSKKEVLPAGELVIIDTDFIYKEDELTVSLENIKEKYRCGKYEARYQYEKQQEMKKQQEER